MARKPFASRTFHITDQNGESVEGYGLIVPRTGPHPYGREGMQIRQDLLRAMAMCPTLRTRALRVYLWLLGNMPAGNRMLISQTWLVEDLRMAKSDVSSAFSELEEAGLLSRDGPTIFIPPTNAWKGRQKFLEKDILERSKENTDFQRFIDPLVEGILALPDGDMFLPRLFFSLWEAKDWRQQVEITPEEIADRMGRTVEDVERGLSRLFAAGLLGLLEEWVFKIPGHVMDWTIDLVQIKRLKEKDPNPSRIFIWEELGRLVLDTQLELPFAPKLRKTAPRERIPPASEPRPPKKAVDRAIDRPLRGRRKRPL